MSTDWESTLRDNRRLIPSSTGFGARPDGPQWPPPGDAKSPLKLEASAEFQLRRRLAACSEGAGPPEGRHAQRFGTAAAPAPGTAVVSVRLVLMVGEVAAFICATVLLACIAGAA